MSDRRSEEFPLFPLGIVALPGELIPLHIFEERYKTMMNECLEGEKEFGIVWLSDDGRLNLLTRGTRPFRVLERQAHLAYPAGVIEFLEDRQETIDPELLGKAHVAYAELVRRATDSEPDTAELAEMGAYAMAATVDFGPDAKQGLLDLRSENARLRLVTRLFHAAVERLELIDRAQERARSNGKIRFGS
jgi:Lon protease-like protein